MKGYLSYFEHNMVAGSSRADVVIYKTAGLLGFLYTTIFRLKLTIHFKITAVVVVLISAKSEREKTAAII